MPSQRFSIWERVGLDIAWAATERVCCFFASDVHSGSVVRGLRRAVRIDGPRIEDELVAARGNERSIVYVRRVVGRMDL